MTSGEVQKLATWSVIQAAFPEADESTRFREELDSLELAQFCLDLEAVLPFAMAEEEIQQLSTIGELLDHVQKKLAA